jgi:hypothetical protein
LACSRTSIQPIPSAAAALDAVKLAVTDSSMPGDDVVDRRSILVGLARRRTSDLTATIAEEYVRPGHHSSPQQIGQRPLRCKGLHLSFVSPQIRAEEGAMCAPWLPSSRETAPEACLSKH